MSFTIKILGSGSATPLKGRHQSAQLVTIDQHSYLVDCGEGTQYRMIEARANFNKIEAIFISHLHGDHFFGVVGLVSTMCLLGRKNPLTIFAPPGLLEIVTMNFKVSGTILDLELRIMELTENTKTVIYEDNGVTVSSFPLKHGVKTFGFLFEEKPRALKLVKEKIPLGMQVSEMVMLKNGEDVISDEGVMKYAVKDFTHPPLKNKSYAYCSDTVYHPDLVHAVAHVDMLYHETTYLEEHKEKAIRNNHATAKEAALIAQQAQVHTLLIGHLSSRYEDFEAHLLEAKTVFPNTIPAIEGKTFTL